MRAYGDELERRLRAATLENRRLAGLDAVDDGGGDGAVVETAGEQRSLAGYYARMNKAAQQKIDKREQVRARKATVQTAPCGAGARAAAQRQAAKVARKDEISEGFDFSRASSRDEIIAQLKPFGCPL